MRIITSVSLLILITTISHAYQAELTDRRNVFTKKGDFYFEKKDFDKAILFYNMAYEKDTTDYLSVLKRAEAYTKLNLYEQAEEAYKIVFSKNVRINNVYRLKYALVLYENKKIEQFKHWINQYQKIIDLEVTGENALVSAENRMKLYKDTCIVLMEGNQPDSIKFMIKYAGYKMKRRPKPEDKQLNIILSNGTDYYISPQGESEFAFNFQPQEKYTLVIRHENIKSENALSRPVYDKDGREKAFLSPTPIEETFIPLEPGMKYQFITGKSSVSSDYLNALKNLVGDYQSGSDDAVDLTALVKELHLAQGEVYTIRFEKGKPQPGTYKKPEISSLTINNQDVNIFGNSFFIVLPLETVMNFNVQTDLEELKNNFNPKKYALKVDDAPVFTGSNFERPIVALTVNTKNTEGIKSDNTFMGTEVGMIPGSEYILTLSKPDPETGEPVEIIVPLTKGVKYNFTAREKGEQEAYKKALANFLVARKDVDLADEEIINISMLSKALEIKGDEDLLFYLEPAKQFGKPTPAGVTSSLMVDDKVFTIGTSEKFRINIPFEFNKKLNIQTDIKYVQENFPDDSYIVRLDTTNFLTEIAIDTTGFGSLEGSGWLSMSVNTTSVDEVNREDQFVAHDVSILPGKEYILTVSKKDAQTGKVDEIIIPLIRDVKYDFTSRKGSDDQYNDALEEFLAGKEKMKTSEGTMIDIKLLSKELKISKGDEVSFSLLPVKNIYKKPENLDQVASSLFLDEKVVEFTHIHKYSINMPLEEGQMSVQTNLDHIRKNFDPGNVNFDIDTMSLFSAITIDTSGLNNRVVEKEKITDPVFDVVIVNFDVNQHNLTAKAKQIIQEKAVNELKTDKRLYVTITGYTDALGDADYNMKLSQKRAESVQEYLKSNGIGDNRIRTFSFGESKTLAEGINWEDLSEAELAKHRKVEIVIYLPK